MATRQLSDGNDDGTTLGQSSSDAIAFYGATPVVRGTLTAYTTTTASVSTSTNWGYTTSTQADAINTVAVQAALLLRNLGLGG